MRRALRTHLRDLAAICVLALLAGGVGAYVLAKQRLELPGWVPLAGDDDFELRGELQTAQAVTPGQGQAVNIAGVRVGDIARVDLVEGRALVSMRIDPRYAPLIRRDASMLLRPRTGLNDMMLELTPGTRAGGRAPEGFTVPVAATLPNVQSDELLAALDGDTRDYLNLLLGGAGEALRGRGRDLSAALRRLEPTARDLARVTSALAERRRNLRRAVRSLRLLAGELAGKDRQLAELVGSAGAVFRSLAAQEGRLREALDLLPGTLAETRAALAGTDRLAVELGPALEGLRPAARELAPALRASRPFLRRTVAPIRDRIRPFARAALPAVERLRPAARELAGLAPDLRDALEVVNRLLNTLAYNPPGSQDEGYLFWAAWSGHTGNSMLSTQDAHGPIRRGLFLASCSGLGILDTTGGVNEVLKTITELLNPPRQSELCPAGGED